MRVLIGTDSGTVSNFHTDSTWQEMDLLVSFGIDAMEVIVTATRHNASYLGVALTPGKLADIIVVDGNPLLSMRDLRHIAYVAKDGNIEKRPR